MKDALGQEIVLRRTYGYSNRSNGIITVVIGEATKITENGVTLYIIYRGKAVYNNQIKEDTYRDRNWVNVISNTLFPISDPVDWKE